MLNFDKFKDITQNPKKYIEETIEETGKKAIGCMPLYVPEEIIVALGMTPVGVWGSKQQVSKAKTYFPAFICSILQTSLENSLNGEYDMLSGMVVSNYCDSLKCMGQNFKLTNDKVPFVHLTIPQNRKIQPGKDFLKSQYELFISQLEEISGNKLEDEALSEAIEIYNDHRKAMNRFVELVAEHPGAVSPTNRNYVMKSAHFIPKEEHTKMVNELIAEIEKLEDDSFTGKRIVTTGIIADSEDLLQIFEENNLSIVGDDVAHESRQYRTLVPAAESPMDRLTEQFSNMECSTLYDQERKRGSNLIDLAKERNADGIVFVMTKFCDPEEYDYPQMMEEFESSGIPHVLIEVDQQMDNYEQARTAIQAFEEIL